MLRNRILAAFLCVALLGSACESVTPTEVAQAPQPTAVSTWTLPFTPSNTPAPTAPPTETAAPPTPPPDTPTLQPTDTPALPGDYGEVVKVVDGDTIDVQISGQVFRVRYIGMNTPETNEPCGAEATAANTGLVSGKTVRLVKDVSERDQYERLLRYVYVGDVFVNAELVAQGYAEAVEYPPDMAQATYLESLEEKARKENLHCYATGIFGGLPTATRPPATATKRPPAATQPPLQPTATTVIEVPTPTLVVEVPTPTPEVSANCDPSYPDVCIPPYPPDLDCKDIPYRRFRVLPPDPHGFDADNDGIGCES